MKYWISIISALCVVIGVYADDSIAVARQNIFDEMGGVEVVQDSAIIRLLNATIEGKQELIEIDGYRMQIYSSNQHQVAKSEALALEAKLKNRVDQTIYVLYLPPFWKVRVGDFRTADEAREYKKNFVEQFPELTGETYIVRDKVKVLP